MKRDKIIFWSATIFIFLFEGLIPALTSQTDLAKESIRHLGYPEYFGSVLVIFKVFGVMTLLIPQIPGKVKEWAYAGFAFDFIFASISHYAVDGFSFNVLYPIIVFGILIVSYLFYYKLKRNQITQIEQNKQ